MYDLSKFSRTAVRVAGIVMTLVATSAGGQATRVLQSVDFTSQEGDRVLLTLTLSKPAPEPMVFSIEKPARLSMDLADTGNALAERYKKVNAGNVRSIASAEAKGRTRVVVELGQLTPYNLRVEDNKIYLQLESPTPAVTALAPQTELSSAPAVASSTTSLPTKSFASPAPGLRAIDFRRGENGEGRIVVGLVNPRTSVDVREEGGKIIATFRGAGVSDDLTKRLDVLDFATPVKFVDTRRDGTNVVLTVTPVTGIEFEQVAYQTGDQFTLELQPLTQEKLEERKEQQPEYSGERISLSFQSIEVRSLLQIIADVAGTNMVVSDAVEGDIAMRLQNVPWDQALDIILRSKGLGMRQQGNVMVVAPLQEIAAREKVELESAKQKSDLAPLRSEIIQVNYAKASDIATLLKSGQNSILSDRGRVSIDERTNTLIMLETREKIDEVRALISRLDIPVRQVLIESRIVIASDDYAKELGTRFGVTTVGRNGNNGLVTTSGSNAATAVTTQSFIQNGGFPVTLGAINDRYNVNLPTQNPNPAGRIGLALLGADYLVDLELSALQSEGRGEVISTPRVITANGKQASIEQGREIPYQESASSGATSVSFKKAVLSLSVTPQITPDDRVVMDLAVTNDSQGENVSTGLGSAPAIDTRRLNTQVLIRSGETVVLGGVFQQENSSSRAKVPLLGDIPLIGALFRNDIKSSNKRELLIFVTPKVLQEGLQTNN
jgi:type IV pilus assembly protein PilQ